MTAVGNVPDVPRNVMPLCSCHFVRLPKKTLFAPVNSNHKCSFHLAVKGSLRIPQLTHSFTTKWCCTDELNSHRKID